jgi:hypothetical protein
MTRRHLAFAGALLALAAAAAAAAAIGAVRTEPRPPDAGAFASRVVALIARNDYGDAWQLLHPLHQAAAPQAQYVGCELRDPIPGRLRSVRVVGIAKEKVAVGGRTEPSEAVRVRIAIDGGPVGTVVLVDTVHAVSVNGTWRWILPADRADRYRAGLCPDGTPAATSPAA